jgi:succinoglycan biosynthesis transport protein ExoP
MSHASMGYDVPSLAVRLQQMAVTSPAAQGPPDIGDYLRVLRARKREIALVVLLLLSSVASFTFWQTPLYTAEASVLVEGIPPASSPGGPLIEPNLVTEGNLLLQSRAIADEVRRKIGRSLPGQELVGSLAVDVLPDTELLQIAYSHPEPKAAARIAQAYAEAYVDFRVRRATEPFRALADATESELAGLVTQLNLLTEQIESTTDPSETARLQTASVRLSTRMSGLEQRLIDLESGESIAGESAVLVRPAAVPTSPSSPDWIRNVLIALFAGLVLGTGVALVRERLDDRVKSRLELERHLGAPVLAAVPKANAGGKTGEPGLLLVLPYGNSPISEAYRFLATNLSHLASREQLKMVMVTSARRGEGKTTTSCNLAVTIARSGRRVILVSADLRRPRLEELFGVGNEAGLSDLLSHSVSLTALTSVMTEPMPNLAVITAGRNPTDPAALLEISRLAQVTSALRKREADFVIVDAPPVLGFADTSALAPLVDGTIFVLDSSHSGRSALSQARDQLDKVGGRLIGVVYNNFDPSATKSDQDFLYDYTEYGEYQDGDTPMSSP